MPPDLEKGRPKHPSRSAISLETLVIAAVASFAAAFVIARIWGPGTLFGAAAAPVIVALVSETLLRPIRAVRTTAKNTPAAARTSSRKPSRVATRADDDGVSTRSQTDARRPRWRLGVITGLAGFVVAAGAITVTDLLAGGSITGNGQPTTFFGGPPKAGTGTRLPTTTTLTTTRTVTTTTPTTTATTTSTPRTTPTTTASTTTAQTMTVTSSTPTVTVTSPTATDTTSAPTTSTSPPTATGTTTASTLTATSPTPTATTFRCV